MAVPVIGKVLNTNDGITLGVWVTAVGTPAFYAAHKPGELGTLCTATDTGTTDANGRRWNVTVRPWAISNRIPTWITIVDAGGTSLPKVEWLCYGSNQDVFHLTETAVHDVLTDHKEIIDRAMQIRLNSLTWPSGRPIEIESLARGLPAFNPKDKYPQISVRMNSHQDDPLLAVPSSDYCPVKGNIYAYSFHSGDVSHEHIVQSLGMAVSDILNQNEWRQLPLANGLWAYEGLVGRVETNEIHDSDVGAWFAIAEMSYSTAIHKGRIQ